MEPRTNTIDLVVDGNAASGAFVIYQAHDLPSLLTNPVVSVQTNTALTNGLRFSMPAAGTSPSQAFFNAVHWPGRTAGDVLCGGTNMVFIPAGAFAMGDSFNDSPDVWGERPVHTVQVSGFCMDKYEVTKALWDEIYAWAVTHGYSFEYGARGETPNHPVQTVTWHDAVKWCNARSEKEGRTPACYLNAAQSVVYRSGQVNVQNDWVKWNAGYRLPTEAEWEKAARGGLSGRRFPLGDTITHAQANYYSRTNDAYNYAYDTSPTRDYHPAYDDGVYPYTGPAGSFAANGYGLHDMAGNVSEWCWDWWDGSYYSVSPGTDPFGPPSGTYRSWRGGSWGNHAIFLRSAFRSFNQPVNRGYFIGFRCVVAGGSAP